MRIIWNAIRAIPDLIVFLLLRCALIDVHFNEVRHRTYVPESPAFLDFADAPLANSSALLQFSKEEYARQEDRAKLMLEKSKNLLTVSTLLVGLLAALPLQALNPVVRLIPLLFVVLTVLLVIFWFGISGIWTPTISKKMIQSKDFEGLLAYDYYDCANSYSYAVNFLVDVYRAARRMFVIAILSLLLITTVAGFQSPMDNTRSESIVVVHPVQKFVENKAVDSQPMIPLHRETLNRTTDPAIRTTDPKK